MVTALCDKWPDFFEVHQEVEDGPATLIFVCQRKNSRSFQADQLAALKWLEHILLGTPHKVVVRIGNVDLTLEQFERGGALGVIVASSRPLAQSTYYAKSAEIKRLKLALETMPFDSPQRLPILNRIAALEQAMGIAESALVDHGQLKESLDGLNKLTSLLREPRKVPDSDHDHELATWTLDDLKQTGVPQLTQQWSELVKRWAKARQNKIEEERINATQQPVVVDPNPLPTENV